MCPIYSAVRPPDVAQWIHLNSRTPSIMKWIRHHRHFGMKPRLSSVKWINITNPGNLAPTRVHRCSICTQIFSTLQNLNRHIQRKHPDGTSAAPPSKPAIHGCSSCSLLFTTRTKRDNHYATTHSCTDCSSCFSSGTDLTCHLNVVHGGIPCPGCSLRFIGKLLLLQHQRSNCGGSHS